MSRFLSRRAALLLFAGVPALLGGAGASASPIVFAPPDAGGKRRVLMIGVSQYQPRDENNEPIASVWRDLGSDADLWVLKSVLTGTRWGFLPADIKMLRTKAQTTRMAIRAALDALAAQTQPGDTVYFHYSGHGGVSYKDDGTPVSTIVPSDWRMRGDERGDNHVTSDELIAHFAKIKAKLAGRGVLFTTFDSCHSGKIVRGDAVVVRGADPRFAQPIPANAKPFGANGNFLSGGAARSRGENDATGDAGIGLGNGFAALFACRYYQSAVEIPDADISAFAPPPVPGAKPSAKASPPKTVSMGRFTYFLAKSLTQASPTTTYDDLYALISGNMAAAGYMDQTPDLRGDTGNALLGGAVARDAALPLALTEDYFGTSVLRLQIGALHGVSVGSTYALYRVGDDPKTAKPVASATVSETATLSAVLLPKPALKSRDALRAVETAHVYGSDPLVVNVKDARAHPAGAAIIAALQTFADAKAGLIRLTDNDNDPRTEIAITRSEPFAARTALSAASGTVSAAPAPGFVLERTQDGTALALVADSAATTPETVAATIADKLHNAAIARVVRGVSQSEGLSGDGVKFSLRLLPYTGAKPAKMARDASGNIPGVAPHDPAKPKTDWRVGESFVIEIANVGTVPGFVNLLDIWPDGVIKMVLPPAPRKNGTPAAWKQRFLPGETQIMSRDDYLLVMDVTEPIGIEQYKLIATATEADFSPLVSRDKSVSRGEGVARSGSTPLGVLLGEMNTGKRGDVVAMPENDTSWCTATVVANVLPK